MLNWSLGGSFVCMPVHLLLIKVLNNIWYLNFIYSDFATKFCNIFKLLLSYVVPVKSKVKISQNFVVCSEYMNFKTIESDTELTKLSSENIKNWPFLEKISSIMFQVNSKKCQIIFKTLIISGFQWMHWCAQKTSTETSN